MSKVNDDESHDFNEEDDYQECLQHSNRFDEEDAVLIAQMNQMEIHHSPEILAPIAPELQNNIRFYSSEKVSNKVCNFYTLPSVARFKTTYYNPHLNIHQLVVPFRAGFISGSGNISF